MAIPKENERYSWKDYQSWPSDERWELFDGEAWAMSPAPNRVHQRILLELGRQFANFLLTSECEVFVAPFDVKLSADTADETPTIVQPDLIVCCDGTKLTDWGMNGCPDLVVEILSPTSGLRDRKIKFDIYERFRVTEYWLIDPEGSVLEIYRIKDTRYERIGAFGLDDRPETPILPGFRLDLSRLFKLRS